MKWFYIPVTAALLTLNSCSLFSLSRQEVPVSPDEAYLPSGGGNAIELGPDQQSLTAALEAEKATARDLREEIDRLKSFQQRLTADLNSANTDLAQTREGRRTAEHDVGELRREARNHETKILMLQIKNAQLEQARILTRLAAIQGMEDTAAASRANATPMSGVRR